MPFVEASGIAAIRFGFSAGGASSVDTDIITPLANTDRQVSLFGSIWWNFEMVSRSSWERLFSASMTWRAERLSYSGLMSGCWMLTVPSNARWSPQASR